MFKAIDKFGSFLKRWTISKKILAVVFIVGFIISLIPIIITCFYSVPVYDDYNFGYYTHKSVLEGGNFFSAIIETNSAFYNDWQGFYTGNILASAQPFNINVGLYFVSNLLVIFTLVAALFYFAKVILKDVMKMNITNYILITIPIVTIIIQFLPDIAEGFYWMDGSLCVFGNALLLLEFAFVIKYHMANNKKQRVLYFIFAIIFAIILSGSDLIIFLTIMLTFGFALIYSLKKKYNVSKLIVVLLAIAIIGFIIELLAPGNSARMARIDESIKMSLPMSIIHSLFYSVTFFGKWTTICFVAVLVFCSVIFYHFAKNSQYNFKNPFLFFILSYGIYAARMSVSLYVAGSLGSPRQYDAYFIYFILAISISALYFVGWLSKKDIIKFDGLCNKKISVVFLIIVFFVFVAGCFDFGVKKISSVSTSLSLIKGETQQYSLEMKNRIAIYEDESIKDVVVKPLTVYPRIFISEPLETDADYWTNRSTAKYYGKNSVVLDKE